MVNRTKGFRHGASGRARGTAVGRERQIACVFPRVLDRRRAISRGRRRSAMRYRPAAAGHGHGAGAAQEGAGRRHAPQQRHTRGRVAAALPRAASPEVVYVPQTIQRSSTVLWWPGYPPYYPLVGPPRVAHCRWNLLGRRHRSGPRLWGAFKWRRHDVDITSCYKHSQNAPVATMHFDPGHRGGVPIAVPRHASVMRLR